MRLGSALLLSPGPALLLSPGPSSACAGRWRNIAVIPGQTPSPAARLAVAVSRVPILLRRPTDFWSTYFRGITHRGSTHAPHFLLRGRWWFPSLTAGRF